jgi:hypothetical protein
VRGGVSYSREVLADAPVSYWRLGESTGTTATDSKGGRHGTYVNGPDLGVDGALGADLDKAVTFHGTNERVEVPYADDLNPATFTLEAWARVDATAGFGTVASSWTYVTSAAGSGFGIWADAGHCYFYVADGKTDSAVDAPITANAWTHTVATYDGTTMRLYINGLLSSSRTAGYEPNTLSPFSIGGATYDGSGWGEFLDGSVDEVAIYSTALSPARIKAHYDAGH